MCMEKITMNVITSKNNKIIKDTKRLLTSSKARQENKSFVLEGARLCFDVLNSVCRIKKFFITQSAYDKYYEQANRLCDIADESFIISNDVAEKLGETANSQGIFCVCEIPNANQNLGDKIIILDNLQDPSNVGAIIRTAEALGIPSIVTYNCCDIYNSKSIRASMGSVLRSNILDVSDIVLFIKNIQSEDYRVYSTVPDFNANKITCVDFKPKVACVIGNEANGVEQNVKDVSDALVTIPMLGRAESLNAAVAASITMWEMLR